MNKTTKEIYQENQIITESINKIMEEASTDREVLSRLRNLKTSTQTQLARSQIDYYIHQIQRKHQKKAGHPSSATIYLINFSTLFKSVLLFDEKVKSSA